MHIIEFVIGLMALAFLGHLGLLGYRERKWQQAVAAYHDRIAGVVTDNLLLKVLEHETLPSEEDIRWELEKQLIDNRHWQPTLGGRLVHAPDISQDWLLNQFYAKVMESKVPETLRRQAYQKLKWPHQ